MESFAGKEYVSEPGNLAGVSDGYVRWFTAELKYRAKDKPEQRRFLEHHLHRVGWTDAQIRAGRAKRKMN